jgi:hypothetical protein
MCIGDFIGAASTVNVLLWSKTHLPGRLRHLRSPSARNPGKTVISFGGLQCHDLPCIRTEIARLAYRAPRIFLVLRQGFAYASSAHRQKLALHFVFMLALPIDQSLGSHLLWEFTVLRVELD